MYASGEFWYLWIPRASVHSEVWAITVWIWKLYKELDAEFTTRCVSWSLPKWVSHKITQFRFHCSGHWQMVVILPKEHLVVWFCSLHNRPNNLKGIINRLVFFSIHLHWNTSTYNTSLKLLLIWNNALKGLDDAPQPKSKASVRWIVVKVHHLHKTSTYIYTSYVSVFSVISKLFN